MKGQPRAFDTLGKIAIVNFPKGFKLKDKKKFAENLLKKHKVIKTVFEKSGKIKGRLRRIPTRYLSGEKTKEVLYKENGCVFRFNIDTTYFSQRLSNERKEIASKIKKGEEVLVMFAGVAPFSIVIAKNSNVKKIYSNEINREANKYARLNIELNNVKNKVELIPGDIKRIADRLGSLQSRSQIDKKLLIKKSSSLTISKDTSVSVRDKLKYSEIPSKFNVIVMPRPRLKNTFLEQAFKLSKKGTRIYYYDFCKIGEENLIIKKIKQEAKKFRKKIKIIKIKKAGEIAPYKIRVRVDFKVL